MAPVMGLAAVWQGIIWGPLLAIASLGSFGGVQVNCYHCMLYSKGKSTWTPIDNTAILSGLSYNLF